MKAYASLSLETAVTFVAIWMATALNLFAGDVSVNLSTRETYVNGPILLEIRIDNAKEYEQPEIPPIDGVEIKSAGAPSTSYQSMMINGRWSERSSVTLTYQLTPLREGTFEIPQLTILVDGKKTTVEPTRFVASKSDAGDLLFVEITASKEKVYVGEPLELTLRIDLKPFRDRKAEITLSEADMWRMLSNQSTWGSFTDRMRELQENNQRPGGREVLREDSEGNQRAYYRYEIDAEIYPTRQGSIDASDIRIVVNYPTKLGRTRSPFDSLLGGDPFNSPLSQMMDDEFFRSPFGNRLAVTEIRPIVGEAQVAPTRVLPVPQAGRPANYRGAVGQYQIVTEASQTTVQAGDPIKLNIGIVGSGPMDLVQAPPLESLSELSEFRVANEPLAGFVRDNAKVFSTTVRPRKAGINEIPAIPFSFFDPDAEEFKTVYSQPIAITVTEAESLGLDAIVGPKTGSTESEERPREADVKQALSLSPNLDIVNSEEILVSQNTGTRLKWATGLVAIPPLFWLFIALVWHREKASAAFSRLFRTPRQRFRIAVNRANTSDELLDAVVIRINSLLGIQQVTSDVDVMVGAIRSAGVYALAAEVESVIAQLRSKDVDELSHDDLRATKRSLLDLDQQIERQLDERKSRRPHQTRHSKRMKGSSISSGTSSLSLVLAFGLSVALSATGNCNENPAAGETISVTAITEQQQRTLLDEASSLYLQATNLSPADVGESRELFEKAAQKFQLLVDSGITNSQLFVNLGNSYLQSRQLGRAIANFERALRLNADNRDAFRNLLYAKKTVEDQRAPVANPDASHRTTNSRTEAIYSLNQQVARLVGDTGRLVLLGIASILFWGLITLWTIGFTVPVKRLAAAPLLLLLISVGSLTLSATEPTGKSAIIVTDSVTVRAGDGEQFDALSTLSSADGETVAILVDRGDWLQIEARELTGWVAARDIERLP